jgi:hypothetical protein
VLEEYRDVLVLNKEVFVVRIKFKIFEYRKSKRGTGIMPSADNFISARFQVLVFSRKLKTKVSVHNTGGISLLVLTKS